jgi:hypothetical protein
VLNTGRVMLKQEVLNGGIVMGGEHEEEEEGGLPEGLEEDEGCLQEDELLGPPDGLEEEDEGLQDEEEDGLPEGLEEEDDGLHEDELLEPPGGVVDGQLLLLLLGPEPDGLELLVLVVVPPVGFVSDAPGAAFDPERPV